MCNIMGPPPAASLRRPSPGRAGGACAIGALARYQIGRRLWGRLASFLTQYFANLALFFQRFLLRIRLPLLFSLPKSPNEIDPLLWIKDKCLLFSFGLAAWLGPSASTTGALATSAAAPWESIFSHLMSNLFIRL